MISGDLDEAKNHILSPYRWILIGTGFLSFWVLLVFQPVFENLHHCIAELLGRDFHIAGGFVTKQCVDAENLHRRPKKSLAIFSTASGTASSTETQIKPSGASPRRSGALQICNKPFQKPVLRAGFFLSTTYIPYVLYTHTPYGIEGELPHEATDEKGGRRHRHGRCDRHCLCCT